MADSQRQLFPVLDTAAGGGSDEMASAHAPAATEETGDIIDDEPVANI